jgi:hypothetical protein
MREAAVAEPRSDKKIQCCEEPILHGFCGGWLFLTVDTPAPSDASLVTIWA